MELRQLTLFLAVAEAGSFTAAARKCGLTQPSLSQQIARLEEELDVRLFDRLGQGVSLTGAGRELLGPARRMLSMAEVAREQVRHAGGSASQHVSVGIMPSVSAAVPGAIRRVREQFPEAQVRVHLGSAAELAQGVIETLIDAAVVTMPVEDQRLLTETVATEHLLLATPEGMAVDAARPLAGLGDAELIVIDDADGPPDLLAEVARRAGRKPGVRVPWSGLELSLALVRAGLGAALVSELAARAWKGGGVAFWGLGAEGPSRELACVWHVGRERSELQRAMVAAIRESCEGLMG